MRANHANDMAGRPYNRHVVCSTIPPNVRFAMERLPIIRQMHVTIHIRQDVLFHAGGTASRVALSPYAYSHNKAR